MTENGGTPAHPAPSSLCVGLRRGAVGSALFATVFLNILYPELKTSIKPFHEIFIPQNRFKNPFFYDFLGATNRTDGSTFLKS